MDRKHCTTCSLNSGTVIKDFGNSSAEYVFVGENPSDFEFKMGEIFSSSGGQLLQQVLKNLKLTDRSYFTNYVKCHFGKQPKKDQLQACGQRLRDTLLRVRPKVIVALGSLAASELLGTKQNIAAIRGLPFWSKEYGCYIVPTYAPGAIIHNPAFFEDFVNDLIKAQAAIDLPKGGVKDIEPHYIVITSKKRALRYLEAMAQEKGSVYSCDIETDGFDYFTQPILDIGFGVRENVQLIFSRPLIDDPDIQTAIDNVFLNQQIQIGFQNGKFDVQFMKASTDIVTFGRLKDCVIPNARNDFDTMLAHYEIDERQGTHGLKVWAREYFNAPDWEGDIRKFLPNKDAGYSNIPNHIRHQYLAFDLYFTRKGIFKFKELMIEEGTYGCFQDVLMPASNALTDIELRGVQLDVVRMQKMFDEGVPLIEQGRKNLEDAARKVGWDPKAYALAKHNEKHAKWAKENMHLPEVQRTKLPGPTEVPKAFNPNSHPQMSYVAYDLCKMPLFEGKKTCNKDAVEVYQHKHPFWKCFAEYKELTDLFGIYIKGMLERVDPDGRIRPDFFLTGTVTGRISCHDPNLQNLPRKSIVKDFFIANNHILEAYDPSKEETVIVNCDYKTLEVVVAAILSNDPEMMQPFIDGEDYHMTTCQAVFGDRISQLRSWQTQKDLRSVFKHILGDAMLMEVREACYKIVGGVHDGTLPESATDEQWVELIDYIVDYLRFLTKFITFGIMYGRKAPSLADGELNCSVAQAQKYIDNFLKKYHHFNLWQVRQQKQAQEHGFVQTLFGHKRRWAFITADTLYAVKNQAVNTPIQGTAAQFCLQRLAKLHQLLKETGFGWVLFTVHDSIVFEIKVKHLQEALTMIQDEMTVSPFDSPVPFEIDVEVGPTYKRVEKVKFDGTWVPAKPDKASAWLIAACQIGS